MAPTICPGDKLVAEGLSLFWRKPRRGEIVVFDASSVPALKLSGRASGAWLNRVIAVPGDRCQINDGKVSINGAPASELDGHRYVLVSNALSNASGLDLSKEVTVPPQQYIVLGDNTNNSFDSRYWGFLPASSIKLVYLCHYWRSADRSTASRPH